MGNQVQSWLGKWSAIAALMCTALPAQAGNPNPGIVPVHARAHGGSYGEWVTAWWQWALSHPADSNPIADGTGEFCDEGQSGPVWFYAGTFGSDVERTCTVPKGKTIFGPVFNWIFGAGVYDCEPSVPGVPCEVDVLRAAAAANTEAAEVLSVTIDGKPVADVEGYRAQSPDAFAIELPEGNVLGLPAGSYAPNVADGYWLMLTPLTPGEHEIVIHVVAPDTIFGLIDFTAVTHITVE